MISCLVGSSSDPTSLAKQLQIPSSLQVTLSRISSDVTAPDADLDTVDRYNFIRNRSKFNKIKKINPGLANYDYKFGLETGQTGQAGQTGLIGQTGQNGQTGLIRQTGQTEQAGETRVDIQSLYIYIIDP